MRAICLLLVALFGTSCVPPTCYGWAYDYSPPKRIVTLHTYTNPHGDLPGGYDPRFSELNDWFHPGVAIDVNAKGGMAVQRKVGWPESCPRIDRVEVETMSREWEPFLEDLSAPLTYWRTMRDPDFEAAGWRPDGPLVNITYSSASGKTLSLLWDGSPLPQKLDPAVMGTLETLCSNSNWARRFLRRDLPAAVASRLQCRP